MRYTLYTCGPDNRSTYPEVADDRSAGRIIRQANTLAEIRAAAEGLGHENYSVHDRRKKAWLRPEQVARGKS